MNPSQTQRFALRVLGAPSVTDSAGVTPPALGWGKPLALLCVLAIRREMRRDEVVDLLWRDVSETKARNAFRQALHRLRSALGDDLIPQDRDKLRLVRTDRIAVDLDAFETAADAGDVDEAIRIYNGDFLENAFLGEPPFDLWAENERTRLRARFRQLLEDAIRRAGVDGRWTDAIARSRQLLAASPYDAPAASIAATALLSAGRRLEALALLREFADRLEADLGLKPPPDVQSLLNRLGKQRDHDADLSRGGPRGGPRGGSAERIGAQPPFVGREAELTQLLTLWRTTREDAGSLALIEAGAGTGKTRLVNELVAHARSLGPMLVLTAKERHAGAQVPFGLFAEALRPLVRAPGVRGASRHLLAEAARLLPELRDQMDLPDVKDVEDEAARLRFFEGIAALMDAAAFEQPILIAMEDLQHIAPSSLDLLTYLTVRLAGSPVAFVLTVRPRDASSATLSRLQALARTSSSSEPSHGPRARLLELSPLFSGPQAGNLIDLHTSTAERIDRLPSGQRRLLLVVALIGRPASAQLLGAAAHLSSGAAADFFGALERDALVRITDLGIEGSDVASAVAIERSTPASRSFLAGWIAETLAGARAGESSPAEVARFYSAAGDARRAFQQWRLAGYAALGMGAIHEALQYFDAARTFAATAVEQEEMTRLLAALGSGRRRLGPAVPAACEADGVPWKQAVPASQEPRAKADVAPLWLRMFPNWRILLGAAIATLVISAVVLAPRGSSLAAAGRAPSSDTLVLSEGESGRAIRYVTGDFAPGFQLSSRAVPPANEPAWVDSLRRPWIAPLAAPNGDRVALARVTPDGSDVLVVSADRSDTIALVIGQGDARGAGWSPDGRWLLVISSRRLAGGGFDADLVAHRIADGAVQAIDTTARRAVVEAAWSPDGSRIAWVARVGDPPDRQLEVFASFADGSGVKNVSRHPADDYHIAWSSDGSLLAFTSMRDGNAELYAAGFLEQRMWRLTSDPAQDDNAAFSPNGRFVAFESTRGAAAAVYVMPALGGEAVRVGAALPVGLRGWAGGAPRHVERVRVDAGTPVPIGDTLRVSLTSLDQLGDSLDAHDVEWSVLDTGTARIASVDEAGRAEIVGVSAGLARVVGSVGRWRFDTAVVRVGNQPLALVDAAGAALLAQLRPLGSPRPALIPASGGAAVALNADREWDSGVLTRRTFPLLPGLTIEVDIAAPLHSASDPATSVSVAIVAPEDPSFIDASAPQFLRYASVAWNADAGRIVYAVGREIFTQSAVTLRGSAFRVRLRVEADSTVSFFITPTLRWRSTLRITDARHESQAQLWIGGRATGDDVRLERARVVLEPVTAQQPVIGIP